MSTEPVNVRTNRFIFSKTPVVGALVACAAPNGKCEYVTVISDVVHIDNGSNNFGVVSKDASGQIITDDIASGVGTITVRGDDIGAGTVAIGAESGETDDRSVTIGRSVKGFAGNNKVAIGGVISTVFSSTAGAFGVVLGCGSKAFDDESVIIGISSNSLAPGTRSVVIGKGSRSEKGSVIIGNNSIDDNVGKCVILGNNITATEEGLYVSHRPNAGSLEPGIDTNLSYSAKFAQFTSNNELRRSFLSENQISSGFYAGDAAERLIIERPGSTIGFSLSNSNYGTATYERIGNVVTLTTKVFYENDGSSTAPVELLLIPNIYIRASVNLSNSEIAGGYIETNSAFPMGVKFEGYTPSGTEPPPYNNFEGMILVTLFRPSLTVNNSLFEIQVTYEPDNVEPVTVIT